MYIICAFYLPVLESLFHNRVELIVANIGRSHNRGELIAADIGRPHIEDSMSDCSEVFPTV